MIKLYCFPRSGNSREVKLALAEKNLPFEQINVHEKDFNKEDSEFRKASPQGKVPAIIDGGVYMSEAYEINEYLEKKYPIPPLMPKDETSRGKIREWVARYDKQLVLKIGLLVIEHLLKPKDQQKEETKVRLRGEIAAAMKEVDTQLTGKEHLFADYSLADIAITPHIAALPILGTGIPVELKNMAAWFGRIQARPSFKKSLL